MAAPVTENLTITKLDDLDSPPTLLSEKEIQFLDSVKCGDISQVKQFIDDGNVDLNCMDANGETPLQLAVVNEHKEVVALLLRSGADIGNALLQAVSRGSVECVDILTKFDKASVSPTQVEGSDEFSSYLTPLLLAAQNNNYEMVKLLISRGYTIEKPSVHPNSCDCESCQSRGGRLGKSLWKLNTYKALASPVYISLSHLLDSKDDLEKASSLNDPIIQAFVLNRALEELADTEYEFRNDYLELSNQCELFAVALLDECRDMEEIENLMTVPGLKNLDHVEVTAENKEAKKLSMLNFAIKNRNEKFVAHAYSQLMLNSVLYRGLHNWEERGAVTKSIFAVLYTILLPFWALIYLIVPTSRFAKYLSVPLIKFLSHTMSFCLFIAILTLNTVKDKFNGDWLVAITIIDVLMALWIAGLVLHEIKEFIREGRERYFSQWWNTATVLMLFLFVAAGFLWLVGFLILRGSSTDTRIPPSELRKAKGKTAYQLILLSNSFFAFGYLLSFMHLSNAFQVNSTIGPMHLSLIKMIRDILKFLLLFLIVFIAFALSLRKVYSQYAFTQSALASNGTQTATVHAFSGLEGSFRNLFWALFGLTELDSLSAEDDAVTQNTGQLLFGLYNITAILVSLNMLIAMMANTFQQVADDADIQWKFTRTRMWMQYVDKGSVLPPPFNLIPTLPAVVAVIRDMCVRFGCGKCRRREGRDILQTPADPTDNRKRMRVIRRLIRRYFFHLERAKMSDS